MAEAEKIIEEEGTSVEIEQDDNSNESNVQVSSTDQADVKQNDDSEDELESYSDNVKKRINQLTAKSCLLYTSPSPRDGLLSRMPSSA